MNNQAAGAEDPDFDKRARARELAAEFESRGDAVGWFDELYRESAGNPELIPWGDLTPNRFFRAFAESTKLSGDGRSALVVGCGLGDDARYLHDLGFRVTAFDVSPTAIGWARRLHVGTDIQFEVCDLFEPFRGWIGAFEYVLEIYTIQPLPLELRPRVIESIASFVAPGGTLVVVTRGREDDEQPDVLPWPASRRELAHFENFGLEQQQFEIMPGDEGEPDRFIVNYRRAVL
jgi:SAM-dependent methyltransferase